MPVTTVLTPAERVRVDAAAQGLYAVLHRESFDEVIADLDVRLPARRREFAQRDTSLGLGSDVDDGEILLDSDDGALDDSAFLRAALGEGLFEHFGEIVARRGSGLGGDGHELSSVKVGAG